MKFQKIVEELLYEMSVAGGAESVFGAGVTSTETAFSKDSYAPGDARNPKSLYGGIMTRKGMKKKKSKSKKS
jgi:hypothetical protein